MNKIKLPSNIYMGCGSIEALAEILEGEHAKRVLIFSDCGVVGSGLLEPKKELLEKPVSKALEEIMENRRAVRTESGSRAPRPVESAEDYAIAVAAPILAEGDVLGCVMFLSHPGSPAATDLEFKLAQTVAGFLGRQMES